MGVHEVTVAQFRAFAKEKESRTSAEWQPDGGAMQINGEWVRKPEFTWKHKDVSQGDDYPVGQLSWDDAVEYCKWLSQKERKKYRLPTEAEWEWACRAGSDAKYHFGDDAKSLGDHAWYADNSEGRSHPVGAKKPNAWGLFDMHGNISEYCLDWSGTYPTGKVIDPRGPQEGDFRVVRSYAFFDSADGLAANVRAAYSQDRSLLHFGMRVLCEENPEGSSGQR
jgi:formylglycine-generating enzyme required for sulfatase activity